MIESGHARWSPRRLEAVAVRKTVLDLEFVFGDPSSTRAHGPCTERRDSEGARDCAVRTGNPQTDRRGKSPVAMGEENAVSHTH